MDKTSFHSNVAPVVYWISMWKAICK